MLFWIEKKGSVCVVQVDPLFKRLGKVYLESGKSQKSRLLGKVASILLPGQILCIATDSPLILSS